MTSFLHCSVFYSADLHAMSFKSCNSDSLKLAYIEIITCGLKVRKQNGEEHCIQCYCCLNVTERRGGKIVLQPTQR